MLTIHNVTMGYPDRTSTQTTRVLEDVSLTLAEGTFACLLGPSGCGKSTLLRIVAGLIKTYSGEVAVEGKRVLGPSGDRALVFQNYGLLPWRTVLGNVEFALEVAGVSRKERREIAHRQIARVGLAGFESYYPRALSGGMQQRTGLARALTKNPVLLLMDEPFAAVDMQTREFLQDELLNIWERERTTCLFVTHSIDEAIYLSDRVLVMDTQPGRIVADVAVDFPRPRHQATTKALPEFSSLAVRLRELLRPPETQTPDPERHA